MTWTNKTGEPLGNEFVEGLHGKPKTPFNYSDTDYFKALSGAAPGTFFTTLPKVGRLTKSWVFIRAKGLSDNKGQFLGVIMVAIDQDFFDQIKEDINVSDRDSLSVSVGEKPIYFYRYPPLPNNVGTPFIPAKNAEDVAYRKANHVIYDT